MVRSKTKRYSISEKVYEKQKELKKIDFEELLDQQFPKGKCKERGHALVLYAVAQIEIDNLKEELKIWKNKYYTAQKAFSEFKRK